MAFPDVYDALILGGAFPDGTPALTGLTMYWPMDDPSAGSVGTGSSGGGATTTTASGSNSVNVSTLTGSGVVHVASTTGFGGSGNIAVVLTDGSVADISYTGVSGGNSFTGCTLVSGAGTMKTGNQVGTVVACIREASGLWLADNSLWFGGVGGNGTLASPSILPGTSSTCWAATGSLTASWAGLSAGQQSAVAQPGPLSWCGWINLVNIVGNSAGSYGMFGEWDGMNIWPNRQTIPFALTGVGTVTTPFYLVPNNTYFVCCTYDRTKAIVYLNGVNVAQQLFTAAVTYSTFNIELGSILSGAAFQGSMQKFACFSTALSQAQAQGLYKAGAASLAETSGENLNVYPFSRQAVAANSSRVSITLYNPSDTSMFVSLGSTSSPAAVGQGVHVPANGKWTSSIWKGAIQVVHGAPLATKLLLIEQH